MTAFQFDWVAEMRQQFAVEMAIRDPRAHMVVSGITSDVVAPRSPLWTRHTLGSMEAERDRRRQAKGRP